MSKIIYEYRRIVPCQSERKGVNHPKSNDSRRSAAPVDDNV